MTDEEQAELQHRHPNWHIRRPAEAPYVMATRQDRDHVTADELYAGLCMTLIEDSPAQLRDALALQRKIEESL
ncbi:MAG: hypothetical protein JWN00_4053 [Actinomycetia bacterium]|nr:hypothetical protein [Actinomycetes bacterium]